MIIDFRIPSARESEETKAMQNGRVTVDGEEIHQVFYADTEAGIVKTFDVFRNFKPTAVRRSADMDDIWVAGDFPGREVDAPPDGVLSETLRGRVELFRRIRMHPPEYERFA